MALSALLNKQFTEPLTTTTLKPVLSVSCGIISCFLESAAICQSLPALGPKTACLLRKAPLLHFSSLMDKTNCNTFLPISRWRNFNQLLSHTALLKQQRLCHQVYHSWSKVVLHPDELASLEIWETDKMKTKQFVHMIDLFWFASILFSLQVFFYVHSADTASLVLMFCPTTIDSIRNDFAVPSPKAPHSTPAQQHPAVWLSADCCKASPTLLNNFYVLWLSDEIIFWRDIRPQVLKCHRLLWSWLRLGEIVVRIFSEMSPKLLFGLALNLLQVSSVFGDPLTSLLAPSSGENFNSSNTLIYDQIPAKLMTVQPSHQ